MKYTTSDVEFESQGLTLRGQLCVPDGEGPFPAVVLTHGFGFVRGIFGLHDFPGGFAAAGFVSLSYDHPHTGRSDGEPRQELDPVAQQRGYSDAITHLCGLDKVDPQRIGIWGTSYSGGHVLAVAAADRRVKCVVSQAQTISGRVNLERRQSADALRDMVARWEQDRLDRVRGVEPAMAGAGSDDTKAFVASNAPEFFEGYINQVTLRSYEWYYSYEPGEQIARVSPTPLLMIVADSDRTTPTADSLDAYGRAREPKKLVLVPGGHYAVYTTLFERCRDEAVAWFTAHLGPAGLTP